MSFLKDISNYTSYSDWLPIIASVFLVDLCGIFIFALFKNTGTEIYNWYKDFGLIAFLADVLVILVIYVLVRYIYKIYVFPKYGFNPFIFIALLVLCQVIHDILYYFLFIKGIRQGRSTIGDYMKKYAKENGTHAIYGDTIMMVSSAIIAMILKGYPPHISIAIIIIDLYLVQYGLTMRRQ